MGYQERGVGKMSKADIRNFPNEVSPEQLKELATVEEKKRSNLVMSLVLDNLADEFEKLEKHFCKKKESAKMSSVRFDKQHKKLCKEADKLFKKNKMKRMN